MGENSDKGFLVALSNQYIIDWFKDRKINLLSLTQIAMTIVENIRSTNNSDIPGEEKKNLAKELISAIFERIRENNLVNDDESKTLNDEIGSKTDYIDDFISIAIDIAHNPSTIQFVNNTDKKPEKSVDSGGGSSKKGSGGKLLRRKDKKEKK